MAFVSDLHQTATNRKSGLRSILARVIRGWEEWKLYRRTYTELSMLSTRELTDLGIDRADIDAIAREAARAARAH